jgi:tetratricopeptide (TPR) repeat protein
VAAELVDSGLPVAKVERALNLAASQASNLAPRTANPGTATTHNRTASSSSSPSSLREGVYESINSLAASWVERSFLAHAAAAYEAVLVADHGAYGATTGLRAGPRCAQAEASLAGLRQVASQLSAGGGQDDAAASVELRCDEYANLPCAGDLLSLVEDAAQQSGRGDHDGAVKTYKNLLRLKGCYAPALQGLVGLSRGLRRLCRLDQASSVCKLLRKAGPLFGPGAVESAEVFCALAQLKRKRMSGGGDGDDSSNAPVLEEVSALLEQAVAVASEGSPEEGSIASLFHAAVAAGEGSPDCERHLEASQNLAAGNSSVHFSRAKALVAIAFGGPSSSSSPSSPASVTGGDGGETSAATPKERGVIMPERIKARLMVQVKQELARVVLLCPASPPSLFLALAEANTNVEDHQGAALALNAAIERTDELFQPGLAAHARCLLGASLEQLGNTEAAVEATEKAATLEPSYPNLSVRLREVRVSHGKAIVAAAAENGGGGEAVVEQLESAVATLSLAAASDQLAPFRRTSAPPGSKEAAAEAEAKAKQLLPYDVSVHEALADAHWKLGLAFEKSGTGVEGFFKALTQYKFSVEHDGARLDARASLGEACRKQAAKLAARKDYSGATRLLQDACRCEPTNAAGFLALGKLLEEQGLLGQAKRVFEQAVSANTGGGDDDSASNSSPVAQEATQKLAKLHDELQDKVKDLQLEATLGGGGASAGGGDSEAADGASAAAAGSGGDPEVALHLGEALEAKGDNDGAVGAYQLALQMHPDHPEALFRLASLLLERHKAEEALREVWGDQGPPVDDHGSDPSVYERLSVQDGGKLVWAKLKVAIKAQGRLRATEVFRYLDHDRSGKVDVEELALALETQFNVKHVPKAVVAEAMRLMDPDGDGALDYAEVVKALKRRDLGEEGELEAKAGAGSSSGKAAAAVARVALGPVIKGKPKLLSDAVQYFRRSAVFLVESAEVQAATGLACAELQRAADAYTTQVASQTFGQQRGGGGGSAAGGVSSSYGAGYVAGAGQTPLDRELAWREAAEALRAACVLSPGHVDAFVGLAETKEALGDVQGSLSLLTHATRLNPRHPLALHRLGALQMKVQNWEEATKFLQRAKEEAGAATGASSGGAAAHQAVSRTSAMAAAADLGACFLAKASEMVAVADALPTPEAKAQAAVAVLETLGESLAADDTNPAAHFQKGFALQRLSGDLQGARVAYQAAMAAFVAKKAKGGAGEGSNDDDFDDDDDNQDATAAAASSSSASPMTSYPDALAGLASVEFASSGGVEEGGEAAAEKALKGFKHAIRVGYTGVPFRVEMAEVLASLQRLQDAAVVYRSIVDEAARASAAANKNPSSSSSSLSRGGGVTAAAVGGAVAAWSGLAKVRERQGRHVDAAECFKSVLALEPNNVRCRIQRGLSLRTAIANVQEGKLGKKKAGSSLGAGAGAAAAGGGLDERSMWQEVERVLMAALSVRSGQAAASDAPALFLPACLALGEAQEFLDRPIPALATYELAVLLHPTSSKEPLLRLGKLNLGNQQFEAAAHFLGLASQLPNNEGMEAAAALQGQLGQALTSLGAKQAANDEPDAALETLKKASALDFLSALPWYHTGLVLLQHKRDAAGASKALKKALDVEPGLAVAHLARAQCLEALGSLQEAVGSYEQAIELGEKTADAYANLGDTLASLGKGTPDPKAAKQQPKASKRASAAALAKTTSGSAASSSSVPPVKTLPPSPAQLHARSKAAEAYATALSLDPYHGPALLGAAMCQHSLHQHSAALDLFRRANALKAHDDNAQFLCAFGTTATTLLDLDAKGRLPQGWSLGEGSGSAAATGGGSAAAAAAAAGEDEEGVSSIKTRARTALWLDAKRVLERCLEVAPNLFYEAYIALAAVRLEFESDDDGALSLVQAAIKVDGSKPSAHVSTAKVLSARGQHDEAISSFLLALGLLEAATGGSGDDSSPEEKALVSAVKPDLAACYTAKGKVAAEAAAAPGLVGTAVGAKKNAEAEKLFESALEHDQSDKAAHSGLSEALYQRAVASDDASQVEGSGFTVDEAVGLYAAALKHRPDFGAAYCKMGLCLERQGLEAEALACQDKAVRFDPQLVEAHRALGRLSTEPEDIVHALEAAVSLVPDDYLLRVQLSQALLEVYRLSEALESGRAAHGLSPKRFEALQLIGDASDGLEAYPTAASAYRKAVATVVDSRSKFSVVVANVAVGSGLDDEQSRKAHLKKHALLERLHVAFKPFGKKKSGSVMDASDVVLLMDALTVPPSAPALQVLRDVVADKAAAGGGSLFGGGKRRKNEISLRDLEEWWLSHGAAAAQDSGGGAAAAMASRGTEALDELDGALGSGQLMFNAPDVADLDSLPGARKALEEVDLAGLYLKLGVAYYRALIQRETDQMQQQQQQPHSGGGAGMQGLPGGGAEGLGGGGSELGGGGGGALAAFGRPQTMGGPAFGTSRVAAIGAGGDYDDDGGGGLLGLGEDGVEITWEAAYRAFQRCADEMEASGQAESAEVLFYLGEACEKLGDRPRALNAFTRAREADPTHADSCARLGAIRGAMGDHDAAVKHAMEALAGEPLHADGQHVLDVANAALASKLCDQGAKLLESGGGGGEVGEVEEQDEEALLEKHGDEALKLFKQAAAQDSTYARAYHLMGNVLEYQGQFAEAAEAQRLAVQHGATEGGYAEAHLALAVSLEAQQRTAEAVEHYDLAVRLLPHGNPSRVDAQLCLADALATNGDLDQAEATYAAVGEVAGRATEKAHAAFGLGSVHRKRGQDLMPAVRSLRDAVGLEPESARYWAALGGACEALAKRAASGRVDRKKVDEPGLWADASSAYGRAIELKEDSNWEAMVGLARVRRQQGMKGLALEKVQQVLSMQPRHPDALTFSGALAAADGKHGEAIRAFAAALTQEPFHSEALFLMGNSLFDIGRAEEAIAAYRKCLGSAGGNNSNSSSAGGATDQVDMLASSDVAHGAAYNLGVVLEQQGDRHGAIANYELASKLALFDTDPLVNLGGVLLAERRFDQAVRTYAKAAAVDPSDPSVQYSLSLALDARGGAGDPEAAKEALDRALRLDPDSTAAQLHAGVMAERSGDYAAAAVSYRAILRSSKPGPRFYLRLGGAMVRDQLVQRMGALYPRSTHDPNAALAPETTAEAFAQQGTDMVAINAGAGAAAQAPGSRSVGAVLHRGIDGGSGTGDGGGGIADSARVAGAAGALGSASGDDEAANAAAVRAGRKAGEAGGATNQSGAGGGGDGLSSLVRSLSLLCGTSVITAYLDVGGNAEATSQISGALEVFRQALKLDPRVESRAQLGIGLCLELSNDLDGAVDAYSRCVELNPRDPDGYERLGVLLDRLGLGSQAREAHTMAAKLRPGQVDVALRLVAAQGRRDGRKLEELASYRRLLDRHPSHAPCHVAVGKALLELGRAQEAVGALTNAISVRDEKALPLVPDYHGLLAKAFEECGRQQEVEKVLNGALRLDPASAELQYHIGAHHKRCLRHDAAFGCFTQVVKDRPSHAGAWHGMGDMHLLSGEVGPAMECMRKASALCKDDPEVYLSLGAVQMAAHQSAEEAATIAADSAAQMLAEESEAKRRANKKARTRARKARKAAEKAAKEGGGGLFGGLGSAAGAGKKKSKEGDDGDSDEEDDLVSDGSSEDEDSEGGSDDNNSDASDEDEAGIYGDDEEASAARVASRRAGEAARKARASDLSEFATARSKARARLREAESAFGKASELWGGHHVECCQKLAEAQGKAGKPDDALFTLKRCLTPALAERPDARAKRLEIFRQLAALATAAIARPSKSAATAAAALALKEQSSSLAVVHQEASAAAAVTATDSAATTDALSPPQLSASVAGRRMEEATSYHLEVLRIDARDPEANCCIGRVHQQQGRGEEAVDALMTAAEADPAKQLDLGQVLQLEGFHLRACEAYRAALAHDPESASARLHLAACTHDAKVEQHEGESLELLDEAIAKLPPGNVPRDFMLQRARILFESVLGGDPAAGACTQAKLEGTALRVPSPELANLLVTAKARKALGEARQQLELAQRTAATSKAEVGGFGSGYLGSSPKPEVLDADIAYHLGQVLLLKEASVRCKVFLAVEEEKKAARLLASGSTATATTVISAAGQAKATAELQDAQEVHRQALEAFKSAVAFVPDDPKLLLRLAAVQRADGLRGEALVALGLVLEVTPRDPSVHMLFGAVCAEQNRLAKAKQSLRKALELDPIHVLALCELGSILRKEGHLDDAVGTFQAALASDTQAPPALVGLALTFETLGSLTSAAKLYEQAREATMSRDPTVLSNLGDVLAARGYVDDALESYETAIALDPQGLSCVEAWLGMGLAHWRGGRYLEAESCHREALAVQPSNADAHHYLADTLRDGAAQPVGAAQGSAASVGARGVGGEAKTLKVGKRDRRGVRARMDEAVLSYQSALKLKPDSVEVLDGLGQALLKCDRIDDARDAFLDALALAGPDTDSQVARAREEEADRRALGGGVESSNLDSGGAGAASSSATSSVLAGGASQREADMTERTVSTALLLTHLANAMLDRGDSKSAVEALRSAIRLQPKLGEAYYQMGRAMHARGKYRKAVTAHRTAVEITPDDPNAYVGLGLALVEEAYAEDAVVALKTAVELGGATDAKTNYKLGVAFAKQRQFPFACQALRWCVVQNPRHMDAWFELAAALRKVCLSTFW